MSVPKKEKSFHQHFEIFKDNNFLCLACLLAKFVSIFFKVEENYVGKQFLQHKYQVTKSELQSGILNSNRHTIYF